MNRYNRFISVVLILSISVILFAQENKYVNNIDRLEKDIPFIRDRYGKNKKGTKKRTDGFKYFLRSLVIPGWGEYELGRKKEAAFFFITDLCLIAAAGGFKYYSSVRENEYKDFAVLYAGIDPSGKDERFWIDIANYDNTEEYNEQKNIDRNYPNRYDEPEDQWQWVSDNKREAYDNIRISSENGDTWFYYSLGAIAVNHLVSAINASSKAPALETKVIQKKDSSGDLKHELKLIYKF